ncbi:transposase [Streptomyces griseofuscus]|uniref:transposase n=1 Tax=Streptomyces griseofuscus TaxID=146922 RepID=UPI0036C27FD3
MGLSSKTWRTVKRREIVPRGVSRLRHDVGCGGGSVVPAGAGQVVGACRSVAAGVQVPSARRGYSPGGRAGGSRSVVCVLTSGCAWQHLPGEFGVSPATAHRRFTAWTKVGVWRRLHRAVLDELGAKDEIDWASAIVDAASVRAKRGAADRAESGRSRQDGRQAARAVRRAGHPARGRRLRADSKSLTSARGRRCGSRPCGALGLRLDGGAGHRPCGRRDRLGLLDGFGVCPALGVFGGGFTWREWLRLRAALSRVRMSRGSDGVTDDISLISRFFVLGTDRS